MEIVRGGEHVHLFAGRFQIGKQCAEFAVARFVPGIRQVPGDEDGINIRALFQLPQQDKVYRLAQNGFRHAAVKHFFGNIMGIGYNGKFHA